MDFTLMIAALIFAMANAVVFGVGLVTVLTVPALAAHAMGLIPIVVVASFVVSAPASWLLAPRLRARYWSPQAAREGMAAPH